MGGEIDYRRRDTRKKPEREREHGSPNASEIMNTKARESEVKTKDEEDNTKCLNFAGRVESKFRPNNRKEKEKELSRYWDGIVEHNVNPTHTSASEASAW